MPNKTKPDKGEEMSQVVHMPSAAARQLGVSLRTLQRMATSGAINAIVLPSGHRRYPQSEIDRIVNGRQVA